MYFENLIGNKKVKDLLNQIINSNNILHSYMFLGEEGVGKKLFAKEFAKMILCTSSENKPCNVCKACIEYNANSNPDLYIIEQEDNIKIEQVRMLQSKIFEKPVTSNRKVYIIDDSDKMTKEAQNCLLKTLEEPPEYITIILITSNENIILNTIKSRCMKISFNRIENNELKTFLEKQYGIQNISSNMIEMYGGSIKKALDLKDRNEDYRSIEELIKKYEYSDIIDILNNADILYKNKDGIFTILEYINVILLSKIKKDKLNSNKYIKCIDIVEKTKISLKANSNFDMSIDNLLLEFWEELNN